MGGTASRAWYLSWPRPQQTLGQGCLQRPAWDTTGSGQGSDDGGASKAAWPWGEGAMKFVWGIEPVNLSTITNQMKEVIEKIEHRFAKGKS